MPQPLFKRHRLLQWSAGATLLASTSLCVAAALPVTITVDASANRRPISPLIYGLNFATTDILRDLRVPINRSGGNNATAYNWRNDAHNTGHDWFFESVPVDPKSVYQYNQRFVESTRAAQAIPVLSVPIIGRVAKLDKDGKPLASFSVAKYGKQQYSDPNVLTDAGNGVAPDGTLIKNDPDDATVPDDPESQQARIAQLVQQDGGAAAGGVQYYAMDNEPSIWQINHRDIHPTGPHASEIAERVIAYSRAVKAADPQAKVMAPEEWGWIGYRYSGFDQQYGAVHGLAHTPDRDSETGGMDYVPWLLKQWKRAGHPIDVFSVHFYPQGGEYKEPVGGPDTPEIALSRNRSTRDLWDPTYKDPTYINSVVALIPLMRKWADTYYYRGTPIALSEYSWGGDNTMNGATAQADVLGIFGREGLDMAQRWGVMTPDMPVYKAIKLFRNYDGKGSAFGDTSIADTQPDPDRVASFAALRDGDRVMTVVVINKQLTQEAAATVALKHFVPDGPVEVWQLADNVLSRVDDIQAADARIEKTVPPSSVTLLVLHGTTRR